MRTIADAVVYFLRSTYSPISFLKKTKKFDIINQLYQEEILRKIKKEG